MAFNCIECHFLNLRSEKLQPVYVVVFIYHSSAFKSQPSTGPKTALECKCSVGITELGCYCWEAHAVLLTWLLGSWIIFSILHPFCLQLHWTRSDFKVLTRSGRFPVGLQYLATVEGKCLAPKAPPHLSHFTTSKDVVKAKRKPAG
jgi:hypothetical protein